MKKVILTIALVGLFFGAAFSQTTGVGTMKVGGSLGFDFQTNKSKSGTTTVTNGKATSVSVMPEFGYFIIDGLVVGAGVNLTNTSFKWENDDKDVETTFTLAPYARYYFDFGVFGHVAGMFGSGKDKSTDAATSTTVETKYGYTGVEVGGGYALWLKDNIAVEPLLVYSSSTRNNKDIDVKNISSGLQLRVGFSIFL